MAQRNRHTLKNYFRQGKRPGEQDFEDLIDSTLNTLDDGFAATPAKGLELTPKTQEGTVITIFKNPEDTHPIWEIGVDKNSSDLQIRHCEGDTVSPVVTFKHNKTTLQQMPEMIFDGVIHSHGRKGTFKTGSVPANGIWHDVFHANDHIEPGCWAFEIVAGCGQRHKGRYALLVATAVQCYGANPKIHTVQSHFGQWGYKIKLRWEKIQGTNRAKLQIKTFFRYDYGTKIHYQITNLWDNPLMQF